MKERPPANWERDWEQPLLGNRHQGVIRKKEWFPLGLGAAGATSGR